MKMIVMTTVLLLLLCTVAEVHSQTYPFVRFGNTGPALSNHSYINLTAVGNSDDGSDTVQCVTDLTTCCRRNQGENRGDWYFPNGTRLGFGNRTRSDNTDSICELRRAQRVDLHHWNNGVANGIYWCTIETNAVHSNDPTDTTTRETVYVGLYASGGEHVQ